MLGTEGAGHYDLVARNLEAFSRAGRSKGRLKVKNQKGQTVVTVAQRWSLKLWLKNTLFNRKAHRSLHEQARETLTSHTASQDLKLRLVYVIQDGTFPFLSKRERRSLFTLASRQTPPLTQHWPSPLNRPDNLSPEPSGIPPVEERPLPDDTDTIHVKPKQSLIALELKHEQSLAMAREEMNRLKAKYPSVSVSDTKLYMRATQSCALQDPDSVQEFEAFNTMLEQHFTSTQQKRLYDQTGIDITTELLNSLKNTYLMNFIKFSKGTSQLPETIH
ncbi:hypothetical protein [Parendozoicomonas sp. Alg238-R29]|uniref:hypothetical protein n=1 Tax=Parendozoicomonas sp. Alg238-R29 TaxID=2993446 RepID=UPI00248DE3F5|nr:hypothetical protein [Parendozoicomonas sp. Alg238-R29]